MSLFNEVDNEIKDIKNQNKKELNDFLVKTEKYRPSNGCEGSWFEDNICGTCKKYDNCKIILNLSFDYVKEIRRYYGTIFCIKHTNFDLSKLLNEVNKQMKVVIQTLDNKKGYIVIAKDGREFIVKDINEAIELKDKLIKGKE